jgi:hypothetical protein
MVRSLILIAALVGSSVRAELQLIPALADYQVEGVKFNRLAFQDGNKNSTYEPPLGWDYSGSGNCLTLRPPGKSQTEATISRLPLPEPYAFTDENLKKLLTEATASVPKNSSTVSVVLQAKNPIRISGKDTFEVIVSYNLLGQTFERSILFLNRDRDQLRFQLTAPNADFKQLQATFQSSLCSWRNL